MFEENCILWDNNILYTMLIRIQELKINFFTNDVCF